MKPQVCLPGLHITLGIFYRLFTLLEDDCHKLDIRVALEKDSALDGGVSYGHYITAIEQRKQIKYDLERYKSLINISNRFSILVPCRLQVEMGHQQDLISILLCLSDEPEEDPQITNLICELQKQTTEQNRLVRFSVVMMKRLTVSSLDLQID